MGADATVAGMAMLAVALLAAGGLSGFLAGLFGIGGGTIVVPVLIEALTVLGVTPAVVTHMAIGSSLAIIIPTAIRSYSAHRARGAPDQELLKSWLIAVPLGVILASFIVAGLSGAALKLIFASVACLMGLKMLFNRDSWQFGTELPGQPWRTMAGFTIGAVSAFMGIGGGNFNNVYMTSYGRTIHQAVATSSGLGLLIAIPGLLGYMWAGWGRPDLPPGSLGYVNLLAVALVTPIALMTAPLGASAAHGLSKRALETAFGLFLIAIAARFAWSVLS
jgi:uncharacterized protein